MISVRKDGTLRVHGPGVRNPYDYVCPGDRPVAGSIVASQSLNWFEDIEGEPKL